jgi:hypothetical protein
VAVGKLQNMKKHEKWEDARGEVKWRHHLLVIRSSMGPSSVTVTPTAPGRRFWNPNVSLKRTQAEKQHKNPGL